MIDLPLLKHFIAVAEALSFTRAADQVHASQSVVSRSIQRLEDHVGAALFERTTRSVRLTPAGEAYLDEARRIFERLALAASNARFIAQGGHATLNIGLCVSADPETPQLVRGFQAFRAAWPNVDVKVTSVMRNVQAQALRAADIDVGVMQLSRVDCDGIAWEVIARDPLVVAVPGLWKLGKRHLTLEELRDRPWIMPDPALGPDMHQIQLELCRAAGFEPRVAGFANDLVASKIMIACGLGAAFVFDRGARQHVDQVEIVTLEGVSEHFISETVVAWATESTASHVREFTRCILEAAA